LDSPSRKASQVIHVGFALIVGLLFAWAIYRDKRAK